MNTIVGGKLLRSSRRKSISGIMPRRKFIKEPMTDTQGKISGLVRIFVMIPAFAVNEKPTADPPWLR